MDLEVSLDEDAAFRTANGKSGKGTMKKSGCCMRAFGPYRIVYDANGQVVQASKRGHPLGNGRPLFLPQQYMSGEWIPYPPSRPMYCIVLLFCYFLCDWQTRGQLVVIAMLDYDF